MVRSKDFCAAGVSQIILAGSVTATQQLPAVSQALLLVLGIKVNNTGKVLIHGIWILQGRTDNKYVNTK